MQRLALCKHFNFTLNAEIFVVATFRGNKFLWVTVAHCNGHVTNFWSVQTFVGVAGPQKLDLDDNFCVYGMPVYLNHDCQQTPTTAMWYDKHSMNWTYSRDSWSE